MMSTAISLPTIAEMDADKFTLTEVDKQLTILSTMLKYGHRSNKSNCKKKLDYYLDIRLELTKNV